MRFVNDTNACLIDYIQLQFNLGISLLTPWTVKKNKSFDKQKGNFDFTLLQIGVLEYIKNKPVWLFINH